MMAMPGHQLHEWLTLGVQADDVGVNLKRVTGCVVPQDAHVSVSVGPAGSARRRSLFESCGGQS
jgi:hypothetical protein